MVLVIKKGASKQSLQAVEQKIIKVHAGFNPDKYIGVISFDKDGMVLQSIMRNEWERSAGRY